jgi:hypothetical protein
MATDSMIFFYSLQCISNVFLIILQNVKSYDQLKLRYKAQILAPLHLYRHVYSMRVRYILPFKSTFIISKFILNTNKRCLVFVMSSFDVNMFSSMLSIFELCQRKQGSCLVFILELSECYISRIAQHLEFIFCVPSRNTIIKNGQDLKSWIWICGYVPLKLKMNQ